MTASKIDILEADIAYSAILAAIHEESFSQSWSEESLRQLLVQPSVSGLLARRGESPCGFMLCQRTGEEAEILTLAVLPALRRQHIAMELVEALKYRARLWSLNRLLLDVAEDNIPARRLYNRCGFLSIAKRKGYYRRADGGRTDAIIMSYTL